MIDQIYSELLEMKLKLLGESAIMRDDADFYEKIIAQYLEKRGKSPKITNIITDVKKRMFYFRIANEDADDFEIIWQNNNLMLTKTKLANETRYHADMFVIGELTPDSLASRKIVYDEGNHIWETIKHVFGQGALDYIQHYLRRYPFF